MKKIKRCIAIILSMVLGFSMSTVSFASERYNQNDNSKGTCSKEDVDLSNGGYTIIYEDGELYIVPSQETRMGGGIGYRQTGLGHDVLCFRLINEDSIYYFCHDLCTSNTLLNSSGIS